MVQPAFINSLPKAGTNLVGKALVLFGYVEAGHLGGGLPADNSLLARGRRLLFGNDRHAIEVGLRSPVSVSRRALERYCRLEQPNAFITGHVGYSEPFCAFLSQHGLKHVLVIRDPRAVVASVVAYALRHQEHFMHERLVRCSVEERYRAALHGGTYEGVVLNPLRRACEALEGWQRRDDVLTIRFEDLVGASGGGSAERQRSTVARLADWIDIDSAGLDRVCAELFGSGNTLTFRKGQIESWRQELPPAIIQEADHELADVLRWWEYPPAQHHVSADA